MSKKLFDASDESDDNELQLSTNKDYAKSYNNFRKKELLKKFKDRGYDVSETESSSESGSSEEDEVLDPKFDEQFFKTLASLKSKNPDIYDKSTRFFYDQVEGSDDADGGKTTEKQQKKSKPVTLKDYERKIILEKGGKFEDDSDTGEDAVDQRAASPTVVEEERRLRAEFKQVMEADDSDEEEFGGIFKKREKSKAEEQQEEEDFAKWLAGKQDYIKEEVKEKLEPLKQYWSNSKLPQSERFLRDYILNKGYAGTNFADIPTYDEIVGDNAPLSEDEQELDKQAEFEHKYNFRFEEPDSEFIQRYPRTIEQSLRRTDDKRKQKRQELKQRKEQEKAQKMKEFEMIKEMKRKEINDKIQKLKMVTGNEELGFKDEELEEDFDPEAHDRRMQEIFNDDYYQVDEGEEKPECPSDLDELKFEDWDNYDPTRGVEGHDDYEPHCEDEDFNMDCDYDAAAGKEQLQQELIDNTKRRKGRKGRRNRFMEMIQSEKPAFDPEDEKTYAEYIDEYYKMDCEDIIGDTPCRFKYVETTPNDFGLTIEEILLAKNKELNQWASLKKAIQIRPDHLEKKEQRLYKMKAKNEDLKRKIFKSLYGEASEDEEEQVPEKTPQVSSAEAQANPGEALDQSAAQTNDKKSKKKRKRKAPATSTVVSSAANKDDDKSKQASEQMDTIPAKLDEPKSTFDVSNHTQKEVGTLSKKKKKNRKKKVAETATQLPGQNNAKLSLKQNVPKQPQANPFTAAKLQNKNMFRSDAAPPSGDLPPLRKTQGINKKLAFGNKFKAKARVFSEQNKSFKSKAKNANDGKALSDERLKAYGINPRKFHKKQKYGNKPN